MPCCKTIVWNKGCRRFCWLPGGVRQGLAQLQARWGEGAFSTPVAARESIQVFEQNLRSVFYGITESDWVSSGPMPWPGEAPWVFSTTSAASQLTAVLGGEFDVLVFNAWAGFHPDRFAMLCGVVRGGGCIVLITPEPEQWPNFPDPEYDRLIGLLDVERDASFHLNVFSPYLYRLVRQLRDEVAGGRVLCGDVPQYLPAHQATAHKKQTAFSPTLTQHQVIVALVEQVERFAIGQFGAEYTDFQCNSFGLQCNSLPPLGMIQGARGRGKSQVLAWLIEAFLASSAVRTVHLLAPHAEAMATIRRFFQDRGVAPTYINTSSKINASSKWIVWENVQTALSRLPLHTSCSTDNEAWRDVLLVEEAATIPFPHLQKLAQFSGSLIVASTTQGYEGSGRILAVRLQEWAYAQARTVSVHTLIEPLRWGLNDPAETCVNRLLLLSDMENGDATERFAAIARSAVSSVRYTWHSSSNLMQAQHEDCLASLWSLLYGAHYRTRPSDLRALLDQPDVYVLMAHDGNHCVGAAWFVLEGPFSDRLQQEMCHNRRRPRGHILPQIWALRLGVRPALGWRHARCVRIAVAPSARQQGVGRGLLETAKTFFSTACAGHSEPIVGIGASFALHNESVQFWLRCGFTPIRYGVARNARSGTSSVMVYVGFTDTLRAKVAAQRRVLLAQLPWLQHYFLEADWLLEAARAAGFADTLTDLCLADRRVLARLHAVCESEEAVVRERLRAYARGTASDSDVAGLLQIVTDTAPCCEKVDECVLERNRLM